MVDSITWQDSDVALASKPAALHGTLTRAVGDVAQPVALILAGSGPTDRDGNPPGMRIDNLKLLAHGLADQGIASLRIDKRGIAASRAAATDERELRLTTYVEDARAWLAFLRQQRNFSHLHLIGHSEGALIATLTAQHEVLSSLILLAGAGERVADVIRRQMPAIGFSAALLEKSDAIIAALKAGESVADVPPELAAWYRPSVQPYLRSWLFVDPAAELAKTTLPTLIIQGSHDLQVSLRDADLLAAAKPGAQHVVIDRMNHVLKMAPQDRDLNIAAYSDPSLPLAPPLVPLIASFIQHHDV
jgi:hypothetical protein